jgi:hypothetical protein
MTGILIFVKAIYFFTRESNCIHGRLEGGFFRGRGVAGNLLTDLHLKDSKKPPPLGD